MSDLLSKAFISGMTALAVSALLVPFPADVSAQKKSASKTKAKSAKPVDELAKLRAEYVTATNEYKASLEKLLVHYKRNAEKAEENFKKVEALFKEGLVSKKDLEDEQAKLAKANEQLADVNQRIVNADTQIAHTLLEVEAEKKLAKIVVPRGGTIQTSTYTRFNGGGGWLLSDAWKVQRFFQDTFKKPLPIAVFGQGAIHDRWRLDHRNSMDISLHPDGPEGQSLLGFLRANGIPFLAFRGAIPGTATGPHIHIGRPSHRY